MLELAPLVALMRMVSPALPIGAFAYSRGLEQAVEKKLVCDEASAQRWILGLLEHSVARLDGPALLRVHAALEAGDVRGAVEWVAFVRASRESRELLLEDEQMGRALLRLCKDLEVPLAKALIERDAYSVVAGFAALGLHHGIERRALVAGLFYATCESQVSAAVRLVPLGQTAGQRILSSALALIPSCVDRALAIEDEDVGGYAPMLALCSAWHETQYSRLFRS